MLKLNGMSAEKKRWAVVVFFIMLGAGTILAAFDRFVPRTEFDSMERRLARIEAQMYEIARTVGAPVVSTERR